jgi:hypothetical protein
MSVTGEFHRYLLALVELLAERETESTALLRGRLEAASSRPHDELAIAAKDSLGALESWRVDSKTTGMLDAGADSLDDRCRDLESICRIILGQ